MDITEVAWRRCPDCDVVWKGSEEACWNCGRTCAPDWSAYPRLTSGSGYGTAITESEWAATRREIGVD